MDELKKIEPRLLLHRLSRRRGWWELVKPKGTPKNVRLFRCNGGYEASVKVGRSSVHISIDLPKNG